MITIVISGLLLIIESLLLTALGIFVYSETFSQTALAWYYPAWLLTTYNFGPFHSWYGAFLAYLLISIILFTIILKSPRKLKMFFFSQIVMLFVAVIIVLPITVSVFGQPDYFYRDRLLSEAKTGNFHSVFNLASAYEAGLYGFPVDEKKAASLFIEAARAGNGEAAHRTARMHLGGKVLPLSKCLALRYFFTAANNHFFQAFYDIGMMYSTGDCVKADPIMAAACFNAISPFNPDDHISLSAMNKFNTLLETLPEDEKKTVVDLSMKLIEHAQNRTLLNAFYPEEEIIDSESLVLQNDN